MVPGRIDGFLLHEHIGEGEMGTIYRATDETLHREVAVKVVRGSLADDPASRERLHKEGVAASRVNHPRVAQVYALNFSNEHPYLVMEYVQGLDFAERLVKEGCIDEPTALRMALDVAEGLTALHREGQIHGDIKPGNIVVDRDGNAKLVDFGLSGMMRHDGRGNLVGTPHFLAPELLRGATDSHRSDLYSLGATLYHLLCGRSPFDGNSPTEILKAKLTQKPAPLSRYAPHISEPTVKLIMQMLENDPAERPADSRAVTQEITKVLALLQKGAAQETPAQTAETTATNSEAVAAARTAPSIGPTLRGPDGSPPAEFKRTMPGHFPGERRPRTLRSPEPPVPAPQKGSRRRAWSLPLLCTVALIVIAVAVKQQSFPRTWEWLCQDGVSSIKSRIRGVGFLQPAPPPDLTLAANRVWHSTALDGASRRGSTLQQGSAMVLQSTGGGMWNGAESGRFVWTAVSNTFALIACVQSIATESTLDITALMVRDDSPDHAAALLFGYRGDGRLFLQQRTSGSAPTSVKISAEPHDPPGFLQLIRRDDAFEAFVSDDGERWRLFAHCERQMPANSQAGLLIAPHDAEKPATAKFTSIRLQPCSTLGSASPDAVVH